LDDTLSDQAHAHVLPCRQIPILIRDDLPAEFRVSSKDLRHWKEEMSDRQFWLAEPDGQLSTVIRSLRLVVHRSDDCARFRVIHQDLHDRTDPETLLASGTESDVNEQRLLR
jgi:hypothetical protein